MAPKRGGGGSHSGSSHGTDSTTSSSSSSGSGSGSSSGGSGIKLTANSVPILFAILYGIMLLYYFRRTIRNPTQVFFMLSLFCTIRVASFVMYTVFYLGSNPMTSVESITMGVLLNVGFFALLYAAYVLVLDREIASGNVFKNPISRVTSNRYLICFILAVAVAIGIVTFVCDSQGNTSAFALQETYAILFLVVTILMGVQTVFQVNAERMQGIPPARPSAKAYIPWLILILLLIHDIYFIVDINLPIYSTVLWWTLWVLPELLAVFLFAIPGLVPEKKILALAPCVYGQPDAAKWP